MSIEFNIFRMYRLNETEQAEFIKEYNEVKRDTQIAVVLALFLGSIGVHHFYMRRYGLFLAALLFAWTFIPMLEGWVEAIFLPKLVKEYNEEQAVRIANTLMLARQISVVPPATPPTTTPASMVERIVVREIVKIPCKYCGSLIDQTATSCPYCGGNLH